MRGNLIMKAILTCLLFLGGGCGPGNSMVEDPDGPVDHIASSCSYDAVNEAYLAAKDGDTIRIPAGNCTWTNSITIDTVNLAIVGAGASETIITSSGTVFYFSGTSGNGARISGIQFKGCNACILFDGINSTKDWRVDNCQFTEATRAIRTDSASRGLVDNNKFLNSYALFLFFNSGSLDTYPIDVGDSITPSTDIVFIEDNTFTITSDCSSIPHTIAGNSAARAVLRYNTFTYEGSSCGWTDAIDAHDSSENWPERGTLGYEIYENRFFMDSNNGRTIHLRGGQHLVYNNFFNTNLVSPIRINNYTFNSAPERCVGNTYDVEDSLETSCPDQINHSYFWGNKDNCGSDMDNCTGGSSITTYNYFPSIVIENIHYYENPMDEYTGYAYPHPLR